MGVEALPSALSTPPSRPSPARGEGEKCPAVAAGENLWVKISPEGVGVGRHPLERMWPMRRASWLVHNLPGKLQRPHVAPRYMCLLPGVQGL